MNLLRLAGRTDQMTLEGAYIWWATAVTLIWFYGGGLAFIFFGRRQCRHYGVFCTCCGPCAWLGYHLLKPDRSCNTQNQ